MATPRLCSIVGCGKSAWSRGWCRMHYMRWYRIGDVGSPKTKSGQSLRYLQDIVFLYEGDECLPWPFSKTDGYAKIFVDGKSRSVSRIVCEHVKGPPPAPEYEAAHSCGRGHLACVTKRHLSWKTHTGNMADKIIHGTEMRGERKWNAKLTEDDVREIRSLKGKISQQKIADQFGVRNQTVSAILRRQAWYWLE